MASCLSNPKKMIDKLPISLNGIEKYATGLTRTTTIDDIKYAMLSVSDSKFKPELLDEYGIFEKWQGNERILDGKIKIHKLIRLWQSLPGDQLSQVQFLIKKRNQQSSQRICKHKLVQRDANIDNRGFKFCSLSPETQKTWNQEKLKRNKISLVKKPIVKDTDEYSVDSYPSLGSDSEDDNHYASIKKLNRSKASSVKKTKEIKKSFVELVCKQNEIIDQQLEKIADLDEINKESYLVKAKRQLSNFVQRSKSSDKLNRKNQLQMEINEHDVSASETVKFLKDSEIAEYAKICTKYFKVQSCLNEKFEQIDELKSEIKSSKISKKLLNSIETQNKQNNTIDDLSNALTKIDDIISLKTKFIESLEDELKRLEEFSDNSSEELAESLIKTDLNNDKYTIRNIKKAIPYQYSTTSTSSSLSSTSSVFTSISSISSSNMMQHQSQTPLSINQKNFNCNNDTESDTGISSANSEDFCTQQLETLV